MIDFNSHENQIAWHKLQDMCTGWYLQPDQIAIEYGVSYIGKYAFSDFSKIKQIEFPNSLKK